MSDARRMMFKTATDVCLGTVVFCGAKYNWLGAIVPPSNVKLCLECVVLALTALKLSWPAIKWIAVRLQKTKQTKE